MTADEKREAFRALKGSVLRKEVYAMDKVPDKSEHPYTVSEQNYTVNLIQPKQCGEGNNDCNKYTVFLVSPRETLDYTLERNPDDPRINHSFTLEIDDFGNVIRSAAVSYGRQNGDPQDEEEEKQKKIWSTCTENKYTTNFINEDDSYRSRLLCETSTYELIIPINPLPVEFQGDVQNYKHFQFRTIDDADKNASVINYEQTPYTGLNSIIQKRLIDRIRILYRKNDLSGPLPFGSTDYMALPFETFKLVFTPGLLIQVYDNRVSNTMLQTEGRYSHFEGDNNWWTTSGHVFYSPDSNDNPIQELDFAQSHFFLPHRWQDPFENNFVVKYDENNKLLVEQEIDPLGSITKASTHDNQGHEFSTLNYRLLKPWLITDINDNRSAVAFDILGIVVGTAVMGKVEENKGDSLDGGFEPDLDNSAVINHIQNPLFNPQDILNNATTRLIYDLYQYQRNSNTATPLPNVIYTIIRESHVSDLAPVETSKIQHSFSYFDGFGREVQKKIQAEPGVVEGNTDNGENNVFADPRWIGTGWTIYNNKGNPVKKYEPFFSPTHEFQFDKRVGVSSTLFYDPLGRLVAILYPNHTYEKTIFDAWTQEIWDVNDTVLNSNPECDLDVGIFFQRLSDPNEYQHTWYQNRINKPLGDEERDAAEKTGLHNGTPTINYFDSIGRAFLSIEDNGTYGKYKTLVNLDIKGNHLKVIDPSSRIVMLYDYDILGNRVKQSSMDAGKRWILNDVMGKPVYNWDSKDRIFHTLYNELRRPLEILLLDGNGAQEKKVEKIVYGESLGELQSKTLNLRGKMFKHFDQTGILTNNQHDFKGNLLISTRQLSIDYKNILDWSNPEDTIAPPDQEIFITSTIYDALSRPVIYIYPNNSKIRYVYNEASLLEKIHGTLKDPDGQDQEVEFVTDINYDAKGQRTLIKYGTGVTTTYKYHTQTFRLIHLNTKREKDDLLQDLYYTYDPVGNITKIKDNAQQTVFFRGQVVQPVLDYTYDPIYRLVIAKGREHLGQINGSLAAPTPTSHTDNPRVDLLHPNNGRLMSTYCEQYSYDRVGNITEVSHNTKCQPSSPGWTRTYIYHEPSSIEPSKTNNRLSNTTVNGVADPYTYDNHGNITSVPNLRMMQWSYKDELRFTSSQRVESGTTPIITCYVYDSVGQRSRKVVESEASEGHEPRLQKERIYIGDFEVYREYLGNKSDNIKLERQTLHIMDDKQRIAFVDIRTKGIDDSQQITTRYQFNNHLGSSVLELDENSQVISYEEYYPYGCTSYQAGQNETEIKRKRYRYSGKERDEETGLYYYGARYYASWLGRWISVDPAIISENKYGCIDNSPYSFVDNRPIIAVDPNGNIIWFVVLIAVAITALTSVSAANAPTSAHDETYNRISDSEYLAHVVVTTASAMGPAARIGGAVLKSTGSRVLAGAAEGATVGTISTPLNKAVSDVAQGKTSTPGEYIRDTAQGAATGAVIGAAAGAASTLGKTVRGKFSKGNLTGQKNIVPKNDSLSDTSNESTAVNKGSENQSSDNIPDSKKGSTPALLSKLKITARHFAEKVGSNQSINKEVNTIILPEAKKMALEDVKAINEGKARVEGNKYYINGRVYGVHNGSLHPIEGEGFVNLNRGSFKALGILNKQGNTSEAYHQISKDPSITKSDLEKAQEIWNKINKK